MFIVTKGHHAGGSEYAYPWHVMHWLNEKYPCISANGEPGKHVRKETHVGDSLQAFGLWSSVSSIEKFDLVFIEFNIGDTFVPAGPLPNALEDKGEIGTVREYKSGWYFEVLLRRLLLLRKPDPVAIVTFNADYIGRKYAGPPWNGECLMPHAMVQCFFSGNVSTSISRTQYHCHMNMCGTPSICFLSRPSSDEEGLDF